MRLPRDIFALIFEKLLEPEWEDDDDDDDDGVPSVPEVETLLRCSLLCRDLRECAQSLIFRHIELDDEEDADKFKILATATSKNPTLGPSVRHLKLRLNRTAYHGHLVLFLSKITNLSTLVLMLTTDTEDTFIQWSYLSKSLRTALEKIMTTQPLSTFSISHAIFPVTQLLPAFTSVQQLSLYLVKDSRDTIPIATSRSLGKKRDDEVARPRRLRITPHFPGPLLKSPRFDWSNIQTLVLETLEDMQYGYLEIETTKEILSKTPNLRSLEITSHQGVTGDLSTLFSKVDTKIYESLVRLAICLDWNDGYEDPPFPFDHTQDPYMGLFDALSTFPPTNKLKSLNLNIRFFFEDVPQFEFDPARWTKIVQILKPTAFPCLESMFLTFYFSCLPDIVGEVEEIMEKINSLSWGDLRASGKLSLTLDCNFDDDGFLDSIDSGSEGSD